MNRNILFLICSGSFIFQNIASAEYLKNQPIVSSVIWNNNEQFKALSSNDNTLCSIKNPSGDLVCYDLYKDSAKLPPNESGVLGKYESISMGREHRCGIAKNGGYLYCWGSNNYGQIGNGSDVYAPYTVKILPNEKFISYATGSRNTYAVTLVGKLYGWGDNSKGQLANPVADSFINRSPQEIALTGKTFFAVTAGDRFFCAISKEGKNALGNYGNIYCAGDNSSGQVGNDTISTKETSLFQVGYKNYISVSAGRAHVCAVTVDQKVECWGNNHLGQLSIDPTYDSFSTSPREIKSSTDANFSYLNFSSVFLFNNSSCALTIDGIPYCFGDNNFGQLGGMPQEGSIIVKDEYGNSMYSHFNPKIPFHGLSFSFVSLTGNARSTCGITANNNMQCWGFISKNTYTSLSVGEGNLCGVSFNGQRAFCSSSENGLANDLANPWNSPMSTPWASQQRFLQVSVGLSQTCGVSTNGELYCWMNPSTSSSTQNIFPQPVTSVTSKLSKIVLGQNHACFINQNDGSMKCSGNNSQGQLGDGTYNSTSMLSGFVNVTAPNVSFTDLAMTKNSTCAISSLNDVYCFGNNQYGELGSGSKAKNSTIPEKIMNLKLSSISAGLNHYCGIVLNASESDNKMVCWGDNSFEQTGSIIPFNPSPVKIKNSARFLSVALGQNTSCAVSKDNKAYCFGSNAHGIISKDKNTQFFLLPLQVQTDKRFISLSLGKNEACGISSLDYTAQCWGN
jgi:alpha-tubulin suppressor-like RCC1 family protein